MYTTLWYILEGKGFHVQAMAFTGIAATLLPKGKTVHKTFALPVPLFNDSTSNIKLQSTAANELKNTDLFIIDEAPMAPRYAMEVANQILKDIMSNDLSFGGKLIILGGDFKQLLPIKPGGTREETVNLSIKFSKCWMFFQIFYLTQNMRALPEEKEFMQYLSDLGEGKLNDSNDNIILPDHCICEQDSDIAEIIFGDLLRNNKIKEASQCAILSARNADVMRLIKEL